MKFEVIKKDVVTSTNTLLKEMAHSGAKSGTVIIANKQTAGKGRMGRSFYSPENTGIYLSVLLREPSLSEPTLLTTAAAVAVMKAISRTTKKEPQVKWVNDIYLGGKKLCGILTEAESNFETVIIEKIIVGVGVNCFPASVPEELTDIMAFMENPPREFSRNQLAVAIANEFFSTIDHFDKPAMLRDYKSRSFILGQQIRIFNPAVARSMGLSPQKEKEGIKARAIDIDENGGLVVEFLEGRRSRQMETLTTGEITIRKIDD